MEVPPVTETKRILRRGDYPGAVLYAYSQALEDLERAYGLTLPPELTHAEILVRQLRPEMGSLPEMFVRLHRLYEPVRYGRAYRASPAELEGLLVSIYSQRPMWTLYTELLAREPTAAPAGGAVPAGAAADDGAGG